MASSERQPLLSAPGLELPAERRPWWQFWPHVTTISPRYRYVPLLGCLIVLLSEAEYCLRIFATLRSIEALWCLEYYQEVDPEIAALGKHIPELLCKNKVIEKQVAQTFATMMLIRTFCSMLGALPLGRIADRYGRKIVIAMHTANVALNNIIILATFVGYPHVPIQLFYLSGVPGFIGGNFDLTLAMLLASYTDVIPSATERATLYYITTSMQFLGLAVLSPIGGWLTDLDGQGGTQILATVISIVVSAGVSPIAVYFWPETLQRANESEVADSAHADQADTSAGPDGDLLPEQQSRTKRWLPTIDLGASGVKVSSILMLGLSLLCTNIAIKSADWYAITQYPVAKLGWTFPQTSVTGSLQAVIYLLNLLVILPIGTQRLTKTLGSPEIASLTVMLVLCLILILGSACLGLSASNPTFIAALVLFTLGEGLPTAMQAFIAALLDKRNLAKVLAVLSLTGTGGKFVASALFPKVFAWGLDSGIEELKGLPFFAGGGLFVLAMVGIALVAWLERGRFTADVNKSDEEHDA